ncbi:MAG: molybdopterin-binding protein [Nannocystaceae bacterium]
MSDPARVSSAAALLIGSELLTGKIRDENGHQLAVFLRRHGIALGEMCTVPDARDVIMRALRRLAGAHDMVFTSGGVGPTHDDVTLDVISQAFGRPRVRDAAMEAVVRSNDRRYLARDDPALRMADLPAGTRLLHDDRWPVLRIDLEPEYRAKLYVLPGVPSLFVAKLDALAAQVGELPTGPGWHLESIETDLDEALLTPHLHALLAAHPEIEIGSYPRWHPGADGRPQLVVRVTLEAERAQSAAVTTATLALARRLRADGAMVKPQPSSSDAHR